MPDTPITPAQTDALAFEEAQHEVELLREDAANQTQMLDRIAKRLGLADDEGLDDAGPFLAAIDALSRGPALAQTDALVSLPEKLTELAEWLRYACPIPGAARHVEQAVAAILSPEPSSEEIIQAAIDNAPEPLRSLGEYLADLLDEDQFKTAERMLLALAKPTAPDALAKLAEIPPAGSEERMRWLEAAGRHVSGAPSNGFGSVFLNQGILTLMSEARKQGQRDVLGAGAADPTLLSDAVEILGIVLEEREAVIGEEDEVLRCLISRLASAETPALATGGARHG